MPTDANGRPLRPEKERSRLVQDTIPLLFGVAPLFSDEFS